MPLPEPDSNTLEHKVGGGVIALAGLPFALAGLAIMILPPFSDSNDAPLVFTISFGAVFFLVGSSLIFGRYAIQINKATLELTQTWSLFAPLKTKSYSIRGAQGITVSHETRRSKNSSYSIYPVRLKFADGETVDFENPRSPNKSRQLAERLAKFLSLPLTDTSLGTPTTRQPDELDLNLKQRLKSGNLETRIPEPPAKLVATIDYDGSRLKVEIPPPGPQPALLLGLLANLLFIGFTAFLVVGPMFERFDSVPLPFQIFLVLFFSIPGGVSLSLLGRMFFFRQSLLADSAIVSHSRGWLFRKVTTLPTDQVEEIILGHVGRNQNKALFGKTGTLLIQSDEKSIQVTSHLPPEEANYLLALLRAVIAS